MAQPNLKTTVSILSLSTVSSVATIIIYSYTGPYLVFTSNNGLDPAQINTLSSTLTIATIISAFFAPLVWNQLGKIGPQTLTDNVLLWITFTLALLAGLTLLRPKKAR